MFLTFADEVGSFLKNEDWIDLKSTSDNHVDIHALYRHFLQWGRSMKIRPMKKDAFFVIVSTSHNIKMGLKVHMRSDGLTYFSGLRLLSNKVETDRSKWMATHFKDEVLRMLRDESTITLGEKLWIDRPEFYQVYKSWCKTNGVEVMPKISFFSLITTSDTFARMGIKIGTRMGRIFVVRGLTATL